MWGSLVGLLIGETKIEEEGEEEGSRAPPQSALKLSAAAAERPFSRSFFPTPSAPPPASLDTACDAILEALCSPSAMVSLPLPAAAASPQQQQQQQPLVPAAPATGAAASADGEVAAVRKLAQTVCQLQDSFLQRLGKEPGDCLHVPCLVLVTHMLHRG